MKEVSAYYDSRSSRTAINTYTMPEYTVSATADQTEITSSHHTHSGGTSGDL
jgi:hypothetical protein